MFQQADLPLALASEDDLDCQHDKQSQLPGGCNPGGSSQASPSVLGSPSPPGSAESGRSGQHVCQCSAAGL